MRNMRRNLGDEDGAVVWANSNAAEDKCVIFVVLEIHRAPCDITDAAILVLLRLVVPLPVGTIMGLMVLVTRHNDAVSLVSTHCQVQRGTHGIV